MNMFGRSESLTINDGTNKKSGLSFLKAVSSYFDSELCLAKIKVNERFKTISFDIKNNKLAVIGYDRVIYYFDIPQE